MSGNAGGDRRVLGGVEDVDRMVEQVIERANRELTLTSPYGPQFRRDSANVRALVRGIIEVVVEIVQDRTSL